MNASNRIQLAAAAALIAAAPVAAPAAQIAYVENPVAIQAVNDTQNEISIPYGAQQLYFNDLSVTFVNHTNVAAKDVAFAVTRDGRTQIVSERGSYAPGTPIAVRLTNDTTVLPASDSKVTIAKVDFADGSAWTPATGLVASR